jgi:hypothetical protein
MQRAEKSILRISWMVASTLFGLAAGIVTGWILAIPCALISDHYVLFTALTGGAMGLLAAVMLGGWFVRTVYEWPTGIFVTTYLMAAVGMLGVFMLVPVFHPLLGIPAGWLWGKRMRVHEKRGIRDGVERCAFFTGATMAVLGAVSAEIATADLYTVDNLRGMLHWPSLTRPVVIAMTIAGLPLLTLVTYHLTRYAGIRAASKD